MSQVMMLYLNLSKKIDKPKKHESKEQFVERASFVMREILTKKFDV